MAIERNELFDLAFRFITETNESIFLTGKAGTGKTTFLKYLKEHTPKNMIVAAPTGVAAINAGGVTLHSLFHLPFHPFIPSAQGKTELLAKIRYNKQKQQLLRKMELLVIDEISMVRCDVLDCVDAILRSVRRNYQTPFGGVQLVCIGDLFQLPPVAQNREWELLKEYYNSPFFFDSLAVKEQQPLLIELTRIYRQKEELFVELLNKVRNNEMEAADFELLHQRLKPGFRPNADEHYITLTTHNNQADLINHQQLQKIPAPVFSYKAKIENDFPENTYPADEVLQLKEGAQVMFLKNDVIDKRYFNGKIGIVTQLSESTIIVKCDDGDITVRKEVWENIRYTLNRATGQLEEEMLGSFEQYPLRLAWAVTVHKSQGLTFEKVMIDASAAFSSGQVYVALSRCTSLDGIVLLSKIPPSALISNQQVADGQKNLAPKNPLVDRFKGARQLFTQQLLDEVFSFSSLEQSFSYLQNQMSRHKELLNEEGFVWAVRFKQTLDQVREVSKKFLLISAELLKTESTVEANTVLQKRISDAASYFTDQLLKLRTELQMHEITTEHKEASVPVDEQLLALANELQTTLYFLDYCRSPFSIHGFLSHKLRLVISKIKISCYAGSRSVTESDLQHSELHYQLRSWRNAVCEENNLPVYLVANGETLKEICYYLPKTKEHLLLIKGMGKAKVEKWGTELLDMINAYCDEYVFDTNTELFSVEPKKPKKEKVSASQDGTFAQTLALHKEGKTISEIAESRRLAVGTIEGHILKLIQENLLEAEGIIEASKMKHLLNEIALQPDLPVTSLKNKLGESFSFFEVRLAILLFKRQNTSSSV
jgi:hypothetical protein